MNPERGLYDSDEDLAAYLARMHTPPEPIKGGYEHSFAPNVQARINAEIQPGYRDPRTGTDVPQVITPTLGATLGPLSLNGGLQLQQAIDPTSGNPFTQARPTFGAGLKVPLFGGDASVGFNVTTDQDRRLEAEWRKKILGGTGEISIGGNYSQPNQGDPNWGVRVRGRIPF